MTSAQQQQHNDSQLLALAVELLRQTVTENTNAVLTLLDAQRQAAIAAREAQQADRDKAAAAFQERQASNQLGGPANALKLFERSRKLEGQTIGTPGGGGAGLVKGIGDAFANIGKMLFAKFAIVLGPLLAFSQVLNANTSGFQILLSAVKVLAATFGPILLPVIFLLSAALIQISDIIWSTIAPALNEFNQLVIGTLLPVVHVIVQHFRLVAESIKDFLSFLGLIKKESKHKTGSARSEDQRAMIEGAREKAKQEALAAGKSEDEAKRAGDAAAKAMVKGIEEGTVKVEPASKSGPQPEAGGSTKIAPAGSGGLSGFGLDKSAMTDTLKEMRMSFGPKASFSSLSGAAKNAQLGALNQSPFEQRMLDRMTKVIESLERVVNNTGAPSVPRY